MIGIVAFCLAAPSLLQPPFVRVWTHPTPESCRVLEVANGKVWFASKSKIGLLDAQTGKAIWEVSPDKWIHPAAIDSGHIYAVGQSNDRSTLMVVDRQTGKHRPIFVSKVTIGAIEGDGKRVFALVAPAVLVAFDAATGRKLWTRDFAPGQKARGVSLCSLLATGKFVHVGTESMRASVDAVTGKIRWSVKEQYGYDRPTPLGNDILARGGKGLQRQDLATGKVKWNKAYGFEGFGIAGNVLIGEDDATIKGVDLANGDLLWSLGGGEEGFRVNMDERLNVGDANTVWISSDKLRAIDKKGEEKWAVKPPFRASPVYADANLLICEDDGRILGYRTGNLPALPTEEEDRKALALALVRDYELSDEAERSRLVDLRHHAFKPMLAKFVGWATEYRKESESKSGEGTYKLYSLITDSAELLQNMFEPEFTSDVVAALNTMGPKETWATILENILQKKGDPALFIPTLVKKLKSGSSTGNMWESTTIGVVASSSHPDAVAFMLASLKDPKANEDVRQEAFRHLAGTGGEPGIAAVLAARPKPGPRKPWVELIDFAKPTGRAKPDMKTDAKGRTWMRFTSGALGNHSDQFMVEKTRQGYGKPLFLGFYTERTFSAEAPKTFRGVAIDKLIAGEWVKLFADDPEIRKDSDGDGLTDLAEQRLATDPNNKDMDGDGLADSVDPCPNAAPRALGDKEKVVAACVEARFFAEDWGSPAVIAAEGMAPFELYGYPRTLIWSTETGRAGLSAVYGGGMNTISFHSPDENSRDPNFIKFSEGGKSARTMISRYSGGLNGDGTEVWLKKIGDEWFVVDMRLRYVS